MPSSFADTYWAGGRLMTIAALNCPCCPVQGLQSDTKAPVPDLALQEPRLAYQHEMEIHKPSQPPGLPRFSIKRRMGPVSWSAVGCGSVANKQIGGGGLPYRMGNTPGTARAQQGTLQDSECLALQAALLKSAPRLPNGAVLLPWLLDGLHARTGLTGTPIEDGGLCGIAQTNPASHGGTRAGVRTGARRGPLLVRAARGSQ